MIYHTALKNRSASFLGIKETFRSDHPKGVMLKHDFVSNGLAPEFKECDVLYAEPPYAHSGLKIFDSRAGVNDRTYSDLIEAMSRILLEWTDPVYLIMSKANLAKLPTPDLIAETRLNGDVVSMGVWNDKNPTLLPSTELICKELGSRYKCLGDFTCGYGTPIKNFIIGGGDRFVASDYDGKCITIVSAQMKKI